MHMLHVVICMCVCVCVGAFVQIHEIYISIYQSGTLVKFPMRALNREAAHMWFVLCFKALLPFTVCSPLLALTPCTRYKSRYFTHSSFSKNHTDLQRLPLFITLSSDEKNVCAERSATSSKASG